MKKIILLIALFVFSVSAFSATEIPFKPLKDTLILGKGATSTDPNITFDIGDGAANPKMNVNETTKIFDFNKGLDITGNGVFSGDISGVGGTFTGNIGAVDGTFTGNVNAVNGTFTGETFTIGNGTNSKMLMDVGAGVANPYFKYDTVSGKLVFANDGVTEKKIGSGAGGGAGGINLLANPGLEDPGTPVLNWTCSGGTSSQDILTNGRDGDEKFLNLNASASSQYCESDLVTISDGIGPGCMADFYQNQGDNSFQMQILDSTNGIVASQDIADYTSFQKTPTLTFDCSPGDQRKLRIISTAAGIVDINEAYLGSNRSIGSGEVVTIGTFTSNLTVVSTNVTVINTLSDKNGGLFTTPAIVGGNIEFTVSKDSLIQVNSGVKATNNAANCTITVNAVSRGSSNSVVSAADPSVGGCSFSEKLTAGDVVNIDLNNQDSTSDNPFSVSAIHVLEYAQAYNPDQAEPQFVKADFSGFTWRNADGYSSSASGVASFTSKGSGGYGVYCDDNSLGGTTCSTGNEFFGIWYRPAVTGLYKVCFSMKKGQRTNNTYYHFNDWVDIEMSPDGIAAFTEVARTGNVDYGDYNTEKGDACGYVEMGSVNTSYRFKVYENYAAASGVLNPAMSEQIISIELVGHNVSRPITLNMVDTSDSNKRINECYITNAGTPTLSSDSCNSWITSLTDAGVGNTTINLKTGVFSSPPSCNFGLLAQDRCSSHAAVPNTTSQVKALTTVCSTNTITDTNFYITCTGSR